MRIRRPWRLNIRNYTPQSLFGRALLILLLPTVLIQMVMAYVFFDSHWDNVLRHMAGTLSGEIAFFTRQLEDVTPQRRDQISNDFMVTTGIDVFFDPYTGFRQYDTSEFGEFRQRLHNKMREPFTVRLIDSGSTVQICIQMHDYVLRLETTSKRLESRTAVIFITWMLGTSFLFLLIAIIFLRNQIRPIRKLAEASDNFGRGVDMPDFRPSGASEVRRAARAFIIMRERIKRQMRTRTDMLSGISHDLRTPLTRMKLQLAMLSDKEAVKELGDDVQQMEHMIQEYLDFARGEGREEAIRINLRGMLEDVVGDYQRLKADVVLKSGTEIAMKIRVSGFRRVLHNLIDNALRYGKRCELTLQASGNSCEIFIDDAGPGIPQEKHEEVFKPFNRLDPSRNVKTGGVGLGLTIARDIVLAHGGSIGLNTAPTGGLRVVIRLPF